MVHEPLWHSPSTNWMLSEDVVHVWRTNLDLPEAQIQALAQTLSPDEHNRANRFHFEKDRRHFIAGRGILRTILGRYLNQEPAQLEFSYSSRGKPALANTGIGEIVSFNLSHSNGLALYAIAQGAPAKPIAQETSAKLSAHASYVGIDLEYMRPMPKVEELAKRFFCPRESAVISSLSDDQKQEVFFQAWTCKEAYLKAIGDGLPGLDGVEVSITPGEPAALLSIQGDQEAASRWSVYQLTPSPGYMAALAVEGQGWTIEYLNLV